MPQTSTKYTTIVIFGASGDLTWRKLGPALYHNFKKGRLTECAHIIDKAGVVRDMFQNHLLQLVAMELKPPGA